MFYLVNYRQHSQNRNRNLLTKVTYVGLRLFILEKKTTSDVYLDPGEHVYPFDFVLPNGIPTSFEHYKGYSRYWLQGIIDIPFSLTRYAHKMITVLNVYDLNTQPSLKVPIGVSERITFCCGPCRTQPVDVTLDVMKSNLIIFLSIFRFL